MNGSRPNPLTACNTAAIRHIHPSRMSLQQLEPIDMHRLNTQRFAIRSARLWVAAIGWICLSVASANDQIPGPPQSRPIVIRGATLHRVDQPVMQNGDLLFNDGRITGIGSDIDIPDNAKIIDASGKHVYPGLIESMTDLGLREISNQSATVDNTEFGSINPNAKSWVAVNPDSELIPVARSGGVLLANVAPLGRWIRGQSAVMMLDGWTYQDMVLSAPSGLCLNWDHITGRGGDADLARRDERLDEFTERLDQARRYALGRQRNGESTSTDLRLESLIPVIEGRVPVIATANRQSAIESAVAFCRTQSLRLIIHGGFDAEQCAKLLKADDIGVLIPGTYRLPIRRSDRYDAAYTLPARLHRAGVRFAIGGEGFGSPGGASLTQNLPYHAGCAVAYGLSREDALRSITLSPAEILGVEDRVGSLTAGKDATLLIADGDILETETQITDAFITGRPVDLGNRHTMLYQKYRQKYRQANR